MFDLNAHLQRQIEFSERTFGPGNRTKGVVDHIRKELTEIEKEPLDLDTAMLSKLKEERDAAERETWQWVKKYTAIEEERDQLLSLLSSFRAAHAALRAAEDEAARLGENADVGKVNAAKQAFHEALGRLL